MIEHESEPEMSKDDINSLVTPTPEVEEPQPVVEPVTQEEPIEDIPPEVTDYVPPKQKELKKKILDTSEKESVTTSSSTINKEKVPKVGLLDSKRKISTLPTKTFIRNVNNSRRQQS